MKYGITKPHLYYKNGVWFCEQKGENQSHSICPSVSLELFVHQKAKKQFANMFKL